MTLDFWDWAYNTPYVRCAERDDAKSVEWLKESWLREADAWIRKGREDARQLYGRDVSHVMLLHVGSLQVPMLPRLLELLDARGFELVTLEEAQKDPIYAEDPGLVFEGGRGFLEQVFEARKLESSSPLEHLTPREREILGEMAQGKSNAAIASTLILSERAVEKHINSIFTKLDLPTGDHTHCRVAAVLLYLGDSGRPPAAGPRNDGV